MKNYSGACLAVTLLQLICSQGPIFIHEELIRGLPSSGFTSADLFSGPMFINEELLRSLPSSDFTSADLFPGTYIHT